MERSYKLLPKAKSDLENIFHYIAIDLVNPESAIELIKKFEKQFKEICIFPEAYSFVRNVGLNNQYLRKSMVDNFIIIYLYEKENDLIIIVRVVHAKRDYIRNV